VSEYLSARWLPAGTSAVCRAAVFKVVDVLDAAGFEMIIVETVGAGQSEVEIAEIADTRVVVCPPGLGDDVQAIKAGILEIADILVVSKADLPLADKTELDLRFMLSVTKHAPRQPTIVRVSAVSGTGMTELADAIGATVRGAGSRRGTGSRERMRRLFAQEAGNLLRERLTALDSAALDELCDAAARGEIGHEDAVTNAIRPGHGWWFMKLPRCLGVRNLPWKPYGYWFYGFLRDGDASYLSRRGLTNSHGIQRRGERRGQHVRLR